MRARQTRIDPLKQQAFFDLHSEDWEHLNQEANHYVPFLSSDLEQGKI